MHTSCRLPHAHFECPSEPSELSLCASPFAPSPPVRLPACCVPRLSFVLPHCLPPCSTSQFDADGSGAVSTAEMALVVRQLKLDMSADQIRAMMQQADPDGSGEIDFEEFVTALRTQMGTGGGQLASIFTEASGLFGFLNPMNWFRKDEPHAPKEHPSGEHALPPPVSLPPPASLSPPASSAPPQRATSPTFDRRRAPKPPPPANPPAADESALRAQIRPLFDKFDADGSGSIDTAEMTTILTAIEVQMSSEAISQMIADADPDGSGEVDFEEFIAVLKMQMEGGAGGSLASVVTEASSVFGFLNPFNWFAPPAPSPPPTPPPPPRLVRPGRRRPGEPRSPVRVYGHSEEWRQRPRKALAEAAPVPPPPPVLKPKQLLRRPVTQLSPEQIEEKLKEFYKC